MAINQNHTFEELDGVKCAIVEKNVSSDRSQFLKGLLEYNGYTVVIIPSPAPKAAPKPAATEGDESMAAPTPAPAPETFTIGVADLAFSMVHAVFGRRLRTRDGHIVTQAYWQQKESVSRDDVPYYERKLK